MKSLLLEGKLLASKFEDEFKARVKNISEKDITPSLATILVGDDPASATYVKMKQAACERDGLNSKKVELPMRTSIYALNHICLQLYPLFAATVQICVYIYIYIYIHMHIFTMAYLPPCRYKGFDHSETTY